MPEERRQERQVEQWFYRAVACRATWRRILLAFVGVPSAVHWIETDAFDEAMEELGMDPDRAFKILKRLREEFVRSEEGVRHMQKVASAMARRKGDSDHEIPIKAVETWLKGKLAARWLRRGVDFEAVVDLGMQAKRVYRIAREEGVSVRHVEDFSGDGMKIADMSKQLSAWLRMQRHALPRSEDGL
jgi:hypothetical protein